MVIYIRTRTWIFVSESTRTIKVACSVPVVAVMVQVGSTEAQAEPFTVPFGGTLPSCKRTASEVRQLRQPVSWLLTSAPGLPRKQQKGEQPKRAMLQPHTRTEDHPRGCIPPEPLSTEWQLSRAAWTFGLPGDRASSCQSAGFHEVYHGNPRPRSGRPKGAGLILSDLLRHSAPLTCSW